MDEHEPKPRTGTGGDPAGGADPGGTRPTKDRSDPGTPATTESGDRNDMTKSDPIKR